MTCKFPKSISKTMAAQNIEEAKPTSSLTIQHIEYANPDIRIRAEYIHKYVCSPLAKTTLNTALNMRQIGSEVIRVARQD